MLTGFQQFLAACLGNTDEETETQPQDEHHTETETDIGTQTAAEPPEAEESAPPETESEAQPANADAVHEDSDRTDRSAPEETQGSDPESEAQPQDTPKPPEASKETESEEPEPEKVPVDLGVIEEIYDFVEMFEDATVSGADQASVSTADCSGGVTKPAIFGHPTAATPAKIAYTLRLPEMKKKERLFLHFSFGLRDGIIFDDADHPVGGVRFGIEISDPQNTEPDRRFEAVSTECEWREEGVELTDYAGKEVVLSFVTACNVDGNSSYAWALWGSPRLRKLRPTRLRKPRRDPEPQVHCGLVMLHFSEGRETLRAFHHPASTRVSEVVEAVLDAHTSEERPAKISIYAAYPTLEIVSVGATAAVVAAGEDYEVQCTLRNTGTAPLGRSDTARVLIKGLKLRRGRPQQTLKAVEPGEETSIFWTARRLQNPGNVPIAVSLRCQTSAGEDRQTEQGEVIVRPEAPKLATKVVPELHTYTEKESVVLGNKHLRIVFVRPPATEAETADSETAAPGFAYYLVFAAKGGNYQQVATSPMLSEVVYLDGSRNRHTFQLMPTDYQLAGNNRGESVVRLSGSETDADGVEWTYRMQWSLSDGATRLKTEYQLEADTERELLAFRGPMLYAGQGRNREKKTAALFPGLEFLENGERSSNPRDAAPPLDNRLVPHPYKITVPAMAVEMQKSTVGLIWNPLETWDGENRMLSAVFASPNWHQHQKNHALGLFLPTVPTWVEENRMEASTPYPMQPDRPLAINAEIIVAGNTSVLDAIAHWNEAYGPPKPLPYPRSDEAEILLSRHGFMETTWDTESRKSRHCVDWAAQNEPGFGTLLWYDYLATKDDAVKQRVSEIADAVIADTGPEGLAARGSCHILRWELPFYIGHLQAALEYMAQETEQRLATQEADGSWRWHPSNPKTATLGTEGEALLGTCAESARLLLKAARITGNKAAREGGLKALTFMRQFSVPRGAQLWECPMYQPDILAAAHAVGAYVEGYELTREKEHLKRAHYWAETALPFLYHWHLPDRPGMQFASIPVFGTTFYTHSWFGVPVQWNGLVLAYYLQRLSQHTDADRWHKIAEGITISAMYQQWEDGPLKGTYPDGFYEFCTEGRGPHLNPEDIMANVYALRGLDPGIKTAIARNIHVSSGARVDQLKQTNKGQLRWKLNYVENETSYTLIVGYGRAPNALQARHRLVTAETRDKAAEPPPPSNKYVQTEVPAVETLEDVESGWLYLKEKDTVLLKYLHPMEEVQFDIS